MRYRRQTDRRQTDGRQHIANVNVSSRSLKKKKRYTKKPRHVTNHVFAETTHVVASLHVWICMRGSTPEFPSFIEICSGVFSPGVGICPFALLWKLAFATGCTTVEAVSNVFCNQRRFCRRRQRALALETKHADKQIRHSTRGPF